MTPAGVSPVPAGAGDHEGAAIVAVGAGAEVGEVVGVEVDHLPGVVAVGLDLRHGDDDGLGAEIHPEVGVGRVGVGGDDELVSGVATDLELVTVLNGAR